jgi:putative hydrolase of the HAD superfamily
MPLESNAPPALLIDFGGVITESVVGAFERACIAHGVDPRAFVAEAFAAEHASDSPFAMVELGLVSVPEFVERIGPVLTRHASQRVDADAWFSEVQQTTQRVDGAMVDALQALYDRGVRTVLLSNSWGPRDTYPWHLLPDFSDVVVSGEVGIRKPDPGIYRLACEKAGRDADECLFVDDVEVNLVPARQLGMSTILHSDRDTTLAELQRVFG